MPVRSVMRNVMDAGTEAGSDHQHLEAAVPHWPLVHCGMGSGKCPGGAKPAGAKARGRNQVLEGIDDSQRTREVNAGGSSVPVYPRRDFHPDVNGSKIFCLAMGAFSRVPRSDYGRVKSGRRGACFCVRIQWPH